MPARTPWLAALSGAIIGSVAAVLWFAPATWLASTVADATGQRVVLANPIGTLWNGSARLEFNGGSGSTDATALPGRVSWRLRPSWTGFTTEVDASCCTTQPMAVATQLRWGGAQVTLSDTVSHWPAALLTGLGTPWNTLQAEGDLQLSTRALAVTVVEGRVSVSGGADIEARHMSSRLSTLRPMGSYRFTVTGGGAGGTTALALETLDGSLLLSGSGQWAGANLRFNGVATAAPEREAALANLLNIIGRRDGARSIITVG